MACPHCLFTSVSKRKRRTSLGYQTFNGPSGYRRGGVVSRCDRRPKQRLNSCGYNKITTTNRKAPAFLRGLLQFGLSLERETGIEPATFCLGSKGSDPI